MASAPRRAAQRRAACELRSSHRLYGCLAGAGAHVVADAAEDEPAVREDVGLDEPLETGSIHRRLS